MEIEFSGAAREVTGSCHLLRVGSRRILLDCGLFQGRRSEARAKNLQLPCPVEAIDAVILSHAHIDHSGRLPLLAARGYGKTVWATAATADLAAVLLADSAHVQESDAAFLARHHRDADPPLYTATDAARVGELLVGVPYHHQFDVAPGIAASFVDAGHILGSASVIIDWTEAGVTRRLVYSGDIGRPGLPIIRDPEPPAKAHVVIMESTYGNRDHASMEESRRELGRVVRSTAARGGRVMIPAFAVGRTQDLIYDLHALHRAGEIPPIPIIIDSPLAMNATAVFSMHPEVFDRAEDMVRTIDELFRFPLLRYTTSVEESKALNARTGPFVVIAGSGMAETGRILHHLAHGAGDPRNTVLIVGFQAQHTLGRRIVERQPMIRVFGTEIPLRATVEVLNGYSAHADRRELVAWLEAVAVQSPGLESVYLVHGEPEAQDALALLLAAPGRTVSAPLSGETHSL
ncbi:MAG TPA: MBL fold metallo-hydrolase [Gemmatimonadaceae bacterium]|nr:MBL fold metallo-hydrolase [Gemmatimonadaceae bacterium]